MFSDGNQKQTQLSAPWLIRCAALIDSLRREIQSKTGHEDRHSLSVPIVKTALACIDLKNGDIWGSHLELTWSDFFVINYE